MTEDTPDISCNIPSDPAQKPPIRFISFLTLTSVVMILLLAGMVELFLRITGMGIPVPSLNPKIFQPDPALGVVLKPDWIGEFAGVEVKTNSQGFRGPEIPPMNERQRRILLVGDSFVFGYGLSGEETLRSHLENTIAPLSHSKEICVINGGIPGYNLVQDVSWTLKIGLAQRPEWIILSIVPNDLEPPVWLVQKTRPDPGDAKTWLEWIKGDPRLLELPGAKWFNVMNLLQRGTKVLLPSQRSLGQDYFRFCNEVLFGTSAWPEAKSSLLRLKAALLEAGIPLTVVLYPVPVNLKSAPFGLFNERIAHFCKDSSLEVLDPIAEWAEIPERKLRWHPDDLHPSGFANRTMAEYLVRNTQQWPGQ